MSTLRLTILAIGLLLGLVAPACRMTSHFPIRDDYASNDWCGDEFVQSTAMGLHFLLFLPLFGDGSLHSAMEEFQDEADQADTLRIRMVDTDTTAYYWWLPPLSFILPLVISNVAGDFDLPDTAEPPPPG